MKKFQRVIISGILFVSMGLSLTGCGSKNGNHDSSSSTKNKTEKTVKDSSKKSNNKSSSSSSSENSSSNASANSAVSTESSDNSSSNGSQAASTSSQKQLGLADVAVWTDENGITHHVDSDGMDRQTISGSSQINYQDWSGSLPSNAQIIHQN